MNTILALLPEILWPLVVFSIAAMSCFAFVRYLDRERSTARVLAAELRATQAEWTSRFDVIERNLHDRITMLEKRVNALSPSLNPLGSHYSTRSAG